MRFVALLPLLFAFGCFRSHTPETADAASDASDASDAASDASVDTTPFDTFLDTPTDVPNDSPEWDAPDSDVSRFRVRYPWNGFSTGSVHVPDAAVANHPLRPLFRWEEQPGVLHYQIQLTRECSARFRDCAFDRPEVDATTAASSFRPDSSLPVSLSTPVGDRYYWRVRACFSGVPCTAWSEVRYLDVGRSEHDYNGDGYADWAVAAHLQDAPEEDSGAVYIYSGGREGTESRPSVRLTAGGSGARFGAAISPAGDVNGDGYADLMVGAYRADFETGEAYLFLGSEDGLSAVPAVVFQPTEETRRFGWAVAGAGDVNGDGYADVAVGNDARFSDNRLEHTYLYMGAARGPANVPEHTLRAAGPAGERTGFGYAMAGVGDVDGDGLADLVVGATPIDGAIGALFFGRRSGVHSQPDLQFLTHISIDRLRIHAAGDIDQDGLADVAIAIIPEVQIFRGNTDRVSLGGLSVTAPEIGADALFAYDAVSGDINGDGFSDLIVGAQRRNAPEDAEGGVAVLFGMGDGYRPPRWIDNPLDQALGGFGNSVSSSCDVNGDGHMDFIVGAPRQDDPEFNAGAAYVFYGSPSGPPLEPSLSLSNPAHQRAGYFGMEVR